MGGCARDGDDWADGDTSPKNIEALCFRCSAVIVVVVVIPAVGFQVS